MTHPHPSNAYMRGLIVIALGLAAFQALGASRAHARNADAWDYEAVVASPSPAPTALAPGGCDDRMDYGAGDIGCGSLTGGPAGGNASRN